MLKKLAAVDRDEPDSTVRAERKRVIVLLSEINANQAARLLERKQAEQRRRDRTVRVGRRVELPTTCARCGIELKEVRSTGRPRLYCSPVCRKAAYEDRRAHRDGAVKVQVVIELRERRIELPHPRSDCINALVRDRTRNAYGPDQPRFGNLSHHVQALHAPLVERAAASPQ